MALTFRRFRIQNSNPYRARLVRLRLVNSLTSMVIIGVIGLFLLTVILFIWYSRDLPYPDKVKQHQGFSTVILDRNEKPVYDIFTDKNRIPISFSDIPEAVKKATISIEDKDFYKHQGFDPRGLLRALFSIITFRGLQGGSTLTQQLVKNVLLTSERTLPRKIKEFILAVQIERKYSKDEILQMYLNEAPYGGTMWGIEAAAEGYFGKHAKDLTPTESIILAGLPQRPSYYSPFSVNANAYKTRAEEVLARLTADGYISQKEELSIKNDLGNVKFASSGGQFIAPHFVLYVKKLLTDMFGDKQVENGGLRVITTLDSDLQRLSEKVMKEELDKIKDLKVSNGGAFAINPQSGEILAYVGSREYDSTDTDFQGKYDVVSQAYRQPGSALKPITYAVAFSKGYTPASVLMDVETHFPGGAGKPDYIPKNYDNKFRGPIQIRYALGNSINVAAVKTTALVGIKDILKNAYDMGLSSLSPTDSNVEKFGLSITLGGAEVRLMDLVSAYGVLATGGIKNDLVSILKVTDSNGKTLYDKKSQVGRRVLGEDVTFLVSHILSDNDARKDVFGPNSYLVIPGKTVSVKTGTTDDKRDNWTVGYTPSIVIGVWVGNNDNSVMNPKLASGATGAAPIWNRVMREALKNKGNEELKAPSDVISLTIDAFGGGLPHEGKPTRNEYFIKGTEPTTISPIYQKIKLSKNDHNKLANPVEIATGNYDEQEFIKFIESDPTSRDSKNQWQEGIDVWVSKQGESIYHPPSDISSNNQNDVVVRIKQPSDKSKIDSNDIEILADAKALKDIKKMEIYVDDSLKKTDSVSLFDTTLHVDDGIHKIKVRAYDSDNHSGESQITIGVKVSPDSATSTPIPSPTAIPPSPTP
ncbi:transglycosylase domain-containing protein [Candidatus Gottesmanbacteria bacterium]|nr:transglycosylase domain-containing protein [Candidatus Gottesmanbacteria bacterium]